MDSIINRLTEIEETASSIVEHAEEQKAVLDKEYDEKRRRFDEELEEKTRARIQTIQSKLDKDTSEILDGQNGAGGKEIQALKEDYAERHTEYAKNILKWITEV